MVPQVLRDHHRSRAEGQCADASPNSYFKNYQGVMVGDGGRNIWLDDFGDEGAGVPASFEIITINNSD